MLVGAYWSSLDYLLAERGGFLSGLKIKDLPRFFDSIFIFYPYFYPQGLRSPNSAPFSHYAHRAQTQTARLQTQSSTSPYPPIKFPPARPHRTPHPPDSEMGPSSAAYTLMWTNYHLLRDYCLSFDTHIVYVSPSALLTKIE